jgi:alpha-tubulin suppressor-like RCC1 family protein
MNRILKLLRGQRGSVGASVLFVMFSAVTMTAIMAVVVTTMNASSSSRNYAISSASAAIKKAGYVGSLVLDPSLTPDAGDKASECIGKACGSVSSITASGNIVTLTLKGLLTGSGVSVDQDTVLRQVNANYVAGYDENGDPAWVNETGTTPHLFKEITSNGDYSCAIDTDTTIAANTDTVWCWGSNVNGQLGDGTTSYSYEPVKVASTQKFSDLSNGTSFGMCALTAAKKAYCWGNNSDGQAGSTNVGKFIATPTAIAGSRSYTQLIQSATTTCGIEDVTKLIYCWGENNGDAVTGSSSTPVQVAGANQYVKMSMDRTTACAVDTTSRILCWSANGLGQVGVSLASAGNTGMEGFTIATAGYRAGAPAAVPAGQDKDQAGSQTPKDLGTGWLDVVVGNEERDDMKSVVCALKTTGAAWCWGSNKTGQLGNGSTIDATAPVQVAGGKIFTKLAVSPETVCGIQKTTNKLWCWGANEFGQVGDGSTIATPLPVAVDPDTTYKTIAAATGNKKWFCGITDTNQARCWGRNSFGQIYTGGTSSVTTPKAIQSISPVSEISLGDHFACVLDTTAVGTCWGRNNVGQVGAGFRSPVAPSLNEWTGPARIAEQPFTFPGFTGYVVGGGE